MILLIDNYDTHMRELYKCISEEYSDFYVIRNDQLCCEDILELSPEAVIIGSGNGCTNDTGVCRDLLSHIIGRIPVLGIGLGAEVLGECFGMNFTDAVTKGKSVFNTGFDASCCIFSSIPSILPCTAEPESIPNEAFMSDVTPAARDEFGRCIAFADNEKNAFGLLVYPDSFGENGKKMICSFVSLVCTKREQNV